MNKFQIRTIVQHSDSTPRFVSDTDYTSMTQTRDVLSGMHTALVKLPSVTIIRSEPELLVYKTESGSIVSQSIQFVRGNSHEV